jgi:glutathione S-transferase
MQSGGIEKRPAFERFVARATQRPAYARATQIDNSLMPQQPQRA